MDHCCSSLPGITPGLKDHLCCLLGNLYRALHRWEFPGIGPPSAWNIWESADFPPGSTSPPLSGIIPGPQDSICLAPSFGSHNCTIRYSECVCLNSQPTLRQDRRRHPCLIIPGPQDSIFLASSVGSHICTIRYSECVCVCFSLKTVSRRVFLCLVFREQFIPAGIVFIFVREPYLYHPVSKVCVHDSLKTVSRRVFLCLIFREQFIPIGIVLSFQRTIDIPSAF